MHVSILSRMLGPILGMVSLAMGLCFLVASVEALRGRPDHAMRATGWSCLLTGLAGGILWQAGRNGLPEHLLRKEAIATVGLGWVLAALFGSLPFLFSEHDISWTHAIFESMSGFTTTGSTVLTGLDEMPDSILLWRSLTQWIGGLGILALIVALLSAYGVSGKSLFGAETSMNLVQAPTSRIKDLTFRLWLVYGGLTLACWLGLWIVGNLGTARISGFHALLYSLTTVSTGGFAPHDGSVGHFQSAAVEVYFCVFMFISSVNMILLVNLTMGNAQAKTGRSELGGLAVMVLIVWMTIVLDLWLNHESEGWAAVRPALFPVVSLSSSTGFGAGDYDQWPLFARCALILVMAVGGCSGSTAGGVKIARLIITLRILKQEINKTFRPKQVFAVNLDGNRIGGDAERGVLVYLVIVAALVLVSTGIISLFEPGIRDLNTAFGAVFATFFNMGPGFGSVGPTDNFAHLHGATLLFLSALMLLGRLEIFVVLALFSRALWSRY